MTRRGSPARRSRSTAARWSRSDVRRRDAQATDIDGEGTQMQIDDMILVSVDDHLVEPPHLFDAHIAPKYRDRAPKIVRTDVGDDVWMFEGDAVPYLGLNAVAGRPREEYGVEP